MSIQEIIQKAAAGEELSEDEKATLADFKPVNEKAIADKIAKREKAKAQEQMQALQDEMEELKGKLEETGGSDAEKLKGQRDRLSAKYEKALEDLNQAKATIEKQGRQFTLEQLKGELSPKLVPDADSDFINYSLGQLIGDRTPEEIAEDRESLLQQFTEKHPSLVASDRKSGTGRQAQNKGGKVNEGHKYSEQELVEMARNNPEKLNTPEVAAQIRQMQAEAHT